MVELLLIIIGYSLEKNLGRETLKGGIEVPQEFMHPPPHGRYTKSKWKFSQLEYLMNTIRYLSVRVIHIVSFFKIQIAF